MEKQGKKREKIQNCKRKLKKKGEKSKYHETGKKSQKEKKIKEKIKEKNPKNQKRMFQKSIFQCQNQVDKNYKKNTSQKSVKYLIFRA